MRKYTAGELKLARTLVAYEVRQVRHSWWLFQTNSLETELEVCSQIERIHKQLSRGGYRPDTSHRACELWARRRTALAGKPPAGASQ